MKPPVSLNSPAQLFADCNLLQEVIPSLFLSTLFLQGSTKVTHVLCWAQLRDPRQEHEGEECDKQPGLTTQRQVGLNTYVLEKGGDIGKKIIFTCLCLCVFVMGGGVLINACLIYFCLNVNEMHCITDNFQVWRKMSLMNVVQYMLAWHRHSHMKTL